VNDSYRDLAVSLSCSEETVCAVFVDGRPLPLHKLPINNISLDEDALQTGINTVPCTSQDEHYWHASMVIMGHHIRRMGVNILRLCHAAQS
jgi:hypothetical protein